MDNPLDSLLGSPEGETEHVDAPVIEPESQAEPEAPAEAPPAKEAPARAADGKFAPKAPASPDAPQTPPAADHAPLSALLDERDKRQAAERRARDLEQRLAAQTPQTPPEPADELRAALYQQNLRASRRFAEREYGKDTIAKVHDWAAVKCDADPHFNQQMRSSDDPYEAAYQAYNRDQIVAKVTPDRLAAFEAWEAAQAGVQEAPDEPHQPATPAPPRSLVSAPGNGLGGKPQTVPEEGGAFASLFS